MGKVSCSFTHDYATTGIFVDNRFKFHPSPCEVGKTVSGRVARRQSPRPPSTDHYIYTVGLYGGHSRVAICEDREWAVLVVFVTTFRPGTYFRYVAGVDVVESVPEPDERSLCHFDVGAGESGSDVLFCYVVMPEV